MNSTQPVPSPVPTSRATATIDGVETQVVAQTFEDKVLVIVTQVGKVGQLIQASLPETLALPPLSSTPPASPLPALPPPHPSTTLLSLFGTPPSPALQPIAEMYVSQIAAIVWFSTGPSEGRKPVVVGLALKRQGERSSDGEEEVEWDTERSRFGQIMKLVMDCKAW